MGNEATQPFTYEPDFTPPTSQATAAVSASLGAQPIPINFHADDAGAGVAEVALLYKTDQPGSQWTTWPVVYPGSANGQFSFIPPVHPLTGPITYFFASRAVDRVDNWETLHASPDTTVIVRPLRLFLPTLARSYLAFANGSFEQGQSPWSLTTGTFAAALVQGQMHGAGDWSARLGSPAFHGSGDVPVGNSSAWQTFSVPTTGARTAHRVVSHPDV